MAKVLLCWSNSEHLTTNRGTVKYRWWWYIQEPQFRKQHEIESRNMFLVAATEEQTQHFEKVNVVRRSGPAHKQKKYRATRLVT